MYGGEASERERKRSNKYKTKKNEQTKYTEEMYYVYNIVCRTL